LNPPIDIFTLSSAIATMLDVATARGIRKWFIRQAIAETRGGDLNASIALSISA
jgi:hypothetical protein